MIMRSMKLFFRIITFGFAFITLTISKVFATDLEDNCLFGKVKEVHDYYIDPKTMLPPQTGDSELIMKFDTKGNLIEQIRYMGMPTVTTQNSTIYNGGERKTFREVYYYNEKGKLTRKEKYTNKERTDFEQYIRNEKGWLTRIDHYYHSFSLSVHSYTDELSRSDIYKWDNNGKLLCIEYVEYYNGVEYSNGREEYVRDSNGKLLEILKKDKNGKLTEHDYMNEKNDNQFSRVYYPNTKKTKTFTYARYDNGKISKCTINFFNSYTFIYEYDKNGNTITYITDYKTTKNTENYKYDSYDAYGNWRVSQDYRDGQLSFMTRREITYY